MAWIKLMIGNIKPLAILPTPEGGRARVRLVQYGEECAVLGHSPDGELCRVRLRRDGAVTEVLHSELTTTRPEDSTGPRT